MQTIPLVAVTRAKPCHAMSHDLPTRFLELAGKLITTAAQSEMADDARVASAENATLLCGRSGIGRAANWTETALECDR